MRRSVVAASACVFALVALAQPPDASRVLAKGGMAPMIGVVEGVRGDKLVLRQYRPETRTATRKVPQTVKEEVDGRTREKTVYADEQYTYTAMVSFPQEYDLAGVRGFDLDGKPISRERLAATFPGPRMALIAHAGMSVDPTFLKIAREGTVLVALPPAPEEAGVAVPVP